MKKNKKEQKILVAGFGGQGVMMIGQMLAYGAMKEGKNSLWHPAYGPETRGGTANCSIIISNDVIYSPIFHKIDILIALNKPSLDKFINKVADDGLIFYNSSLILEDIYTTHKVIKIPINEMALKLGNPRVSNMIMLGSFLEVTKLIQIEIIKETLQEYLGKEKENLFNINNKAITEGQNYITELNKND